MFKQHSRDYLEYICQIEKLQHTYRKNAQLFRQTSFGIAPAAFPTVSPWKSFLSGCMLVHMPAKDLSKGGFMQVSNDAQWFPFVSSCAIQEFEMPLDQLGLAHVPVLRHLQPLWLFHSRETYCRAQSIGILRLPRATRGIYV